MKNLCHNNLFTCSRVCCKYDLSTQISVSLSYTGLVKSKIKGDVNPDKLPPIKRAVYYHTFRVHIQILILEILDNNDLDQLDWGSSLSRGTLRCLKDVFMP